MKITLFFCAGLFAETLSLHRSASWRGGSPHALTSRGLHRRGRGHDRAAPGGRVRLQVAPRPRLASTRASPGSSWSSSRAACSTRRTSCRSSTPCGSGRPRSAVAAVGSARDPPPVEAPKALLLPAVVTAVLALLAGLLAPLPYSPLEMAGRSRRGATRDCDHAVGRVRPRPVDDRARCWVWSAWARDEVSARVAATLVRLGAAGRAAHGLLARRRAARRSGRHARGCCSARAWRSTSSAARCCCSQCCSTASRWWWCARTHERAPVLSGVPAHERSSATQACSSPPTP
jgi:hypothetical protein